PKLKLFQALLAGCCLLLFMPSAWAQFTWPVYESFGQYTNDTRLGSTATNAAVPVWCHVGNTATASKPRGFDPNAMSVTGLVADTNLVPKGTISSSVTGSHDAGAHFTSRPGTIYVSFLVSNIFNAGGLNADRMFFNLADSDSATSFRMW